MPGEEHPERRRLVDNPARGGNEEPSYDLYLGEERQPAHARSMARTLGDQRPLQHALHIGRRHRRREEVALSVPTAQAAQAIALRFPLDPLSHGVQAEGGAESHDCRSESLLVGARADLVDEGLAILRMSTGKRRR